MLYQKTILIISTKVAIILLITNGRKKGRTLKFPDTMSRVDAYSIWICYLPK